MAVHAPQNSFSLSLSLSHSTCPSLSFSLPLLPVEYFVATAALAPLLLLLCRLISTQWMSKSAWINAPSQEKGGIAGLGFAIPWPPLSQQRPSPKFVYNLSRCYRCDCVTWLCHSLSVVLAVNARAGCVSLFARGQPPTPCRHCCSFRYRLGGRGNDVGTVSWQCCDSLQIVLYNEQCRNGVGTMLVTVFRTVCRTTLKQSRSKSVGRNLIEIVSELHT